MKKLALVIFFMCCFNYCSFAQSGWVRQNSGTNYILYDAQFLNSNIGFAAGANADTTQGVLLKTTDGGNSWVSRNVNIGVSCMFFLDANTGYIGGRKGNFIMRTTNGGAYWVQQYIPQGFATPSRANDIFFLNSNTGFIATNNALYSTSNSGANWSIASTLNKPYFQYFYFINQSTGLVMGADCMKTTNGGTNWEQIASAGFTFEISGYDENNLMTLGMGPSYLISTNGGGNWGEDPLFIKGAWKDTSFNSCKYFGPDNAMIIGGGGKIYKATSSIVSWVVQPSGVGSTLYKLFFINQNTGWIVGANGVILKTTTGGTVGFTQISAEVPGKYLLTQNYPNPFNPETKISFSVPENSFISLKVFNSAGKEVSELVNENISRGSYDVSFNASSLPSGVYYYKLTAQNFSETRKMMLIK